MVRRIPSRSVAPTDENDVAHALRSRERGNPSELIGERR